jgi:hypothetical protein
MKKNSWLIKHRPRPKILQYEALGIAFLAHFHNILELNIKMQQQLFHWLRNTKQLNIWNLTKVNGIHETKQETNYEMKRNFTSDETKRNEISLFLLFRETSKITRIKFFVLLCFVFRETKKRMQNGNPTYKKPVFKSFLWEKTLLLMLLYIQTFYAFRVLIKY